MRDKAMMVANLHAGTAFEHKGKLFFMLDTRLGRYPAVCKYGRLHQFNGDEIVKLPPSSFKRYVIEGRTGLSREEYETWIFGIYRNKKKAEEVVKRLDTEFQSLYWKFDGKEYTQRRMHNYQRLAGGIDSQARTNVTWREVPAYVIVESEQMD